MVRAKRSLSQNFLVDPNIRRKVVASLEATPEDQVLEVGPGHGELTDLLVGRVSRLVAVEKDDALHAALAERLGMRTDTWIVHADALRCDLSALVESSRPLRIISSIPYSITSPLLFRLLDVRPAAHRLVVIVQREVGDRIAAPPGSRTYGALSVGVQARAVAKVTFRIGRRAFRPVPSVDSVAVVIEPRPQGPSPAQIETLRRLTRVAFSMRRKQLQKILRSAPEYGLPPDEAAAVLADVGLRGDERPEDLPASVFLALALRLERSTPPSSG